MKLNFERVENHPSECASFTAAACRAGFVPSALTKLERWSRRSVRQQADPPLRRKAFLPTTSGNLYVVADPMPSWSCSGCTGSVDAIDLSQAGAQAAPIYSYSSRTYTCTNNLGNVVNSIDINSPPNFNIWGTLVSVTINVSTADTGGNSSLPLNVAAEFNNMPTISPSAVVGSFGPIVSLKTAGTRTITPSGVTGTQTGDTLASPGTVAFTGETVPYLATSLTGETAGQCPVVTVTWQTSRD
jgi:hypothetical protein